MPFLTDQAYPFTKNTDAFQVKGAQDLSKAFIASLSAFIRSGNPNTVLLGNTWNKWNPDYRPEMIFDANRSQARIYSVNSRVSYEGVLAELTNDKSISEESKKYIIKNVLNGCCFSGRLDEKYADVD